jgi:molecular chaperone GrpE
MSSNESGINDYIENPSDTDIVVEESEVSIPEAEKSTESEGDQDVLAALQSEIASLKQQLTEQTEKADNFKSQYIRIVADFDNFRKRTNKDKEIFEYQVKRTTITELLPVIDNFERARTQIKPTNDGEQGIHKSYQGVYKILVDSLKRIGVSPMRPQGQPFDPNFHEAMLREATDEYPEGTVIEELMRGYLLEDQVLRHAMVKVAAPKETENLTEEPTESAES